MCISASGLLGRHGLATEFPQQQVCVIYTPQTNRKVEFWQPSLRKNYISFLILVETFGQRLECFPSSISSAAGDQRSPGHSALSSLVENWHDCILNLHCRMEERHQAEAGQGLRKNFRERALGDLGEEFPKPKLEMMRCHLQQQHEVPPRAVFWAQPLLPTRSLAAIPISVSEGQDEVWAWPPLLSYFMSKVTLTSCKKNCKMLSPATGALESESKFFFQPLLSLAALLLWQQIQKKEGCVGCRCQSYQCRLVYPESLHATTTSPSVTKHL